MKSKEELEKLENARKITRVSRPDRRERNSNKIRFGNVRNTGPEQNTPIIKGDIDEVVDEELDSLDVSHPVRRETSLA